MARPFSAILEDSKRFIFYAALAFTLCSIAALELILTQPANSLTLPKTNPNWQLGRLDNGMDVFVITDKRVPVVTHMVWYKVGSADEPEGKSGIAHYFEHLMFKGTDKIEAGAFSKKVAALGGQDNAFTSYDYTAYFQRVGVEHLETVMTMEANRMQNLILTDAVINAERDVVLEERSMRTDTNPAALLNEAMRAKLYGDHPYGIPVIGWRKEIEQLSLNDAIRFYQRYYAPDNAILVVVGDVEFAEVMRLAKKHYGPLKAQNKPREKRPALIPLQTAITLERTDKRTQQMQWSRYYQLFLPTDKTIQRQHIAALDVLFEILNQSSISPLYQTLVKDKKLATQISAYAVTSMLDEGYLVFFVTPQNNTDIAALETAITENLTQAGQKLFSQADLQQAKMSLLSDYFYSQDQQFVMARIFGATLANGERPEDIAAWVDAVENVQAEDVRQAAKLYLDPVKSVTGILRPAHTTTQGIAQ